MNNLLPTPYQEFIHKSRYARWVEDEGRRENYDETVDRYVGIMSDHLKDKFDYVLPEADVEDLREAILNLEIMPPCGL